MSRIDGMAHEYEHRLMQRLSEGDEKAFRELFESYYPKVRAFVDCIVKESDTSEDIAQDIFAKIWERREIFWGGDVQSFGGYIYKMARNAALNHIRRTVNINLAQIPQIEEKVGDESFEDEYYAREKELFIRLVVCRMPEQRRRIFEMSRYLGLDNQTIADTLHISKKTVENHLTLALKELRNALAVFSVFFFIGQ